MSAGAQAADETFSPGLGWSLLRLASFAMVATCLFLLLARPETGLKLFWGVLVPLLPAVFVLAPGLWRNICPLALTNQFPQRLGLGKGRHMSEGQQAGATALALVGFCAFVMLRQPLLNASGLATALLLVLAFSLAFYGGMVFKGKSGWCGTFCPLGPIQRFYGMAPTVEVRQNVCASCVGCQKLCYDLSPGRSTFDIADDPKGLLQRLFTVFIACLPGFIAAYFHTLAHAAGFDLSYLGVFGIYASASLGVYLGATVLLALPRYETNLVFSSLALVIFYFHTGGTLVANAAGLMHIAVPSLLTTAGSGLGFVLALNQFVIGRENALTFLSYRQSKAQVPAKPRAERQFNLTFHPHGEIATTDNQLLLNAIEDAGIAIKASCRSGLCGSDLVYVSEGAENLSPPGDDELATLTRLGVLGKARLACSCRARGPAVISTEEPAVARLAAVPESPVAAARIAYAIGQAERFRKINHLPGGVLIIGSGIGGVTAAEELRKAGFTPPVTVASVDARPLYNRMALAKVVDSSKAPADLSLLPESWFEDRNIVFAPGTRISGIDRENKIAVSEDGRIFPYGKLILATGAAARLPVPGYHGHVNCYSLRTLEDAEAIREALTRGNAKSCVILGAGVLGFEIAEVLARMGKSVTLVGRGQGLLGTALDSESNWLLQRHFTQLGIAMNFGLQLSSLQASPQGQIAYFSDGSKIEADACIACVGVSPNVDLALQCGLAVKNGVLVDERMRTSDLDIYAVGDVATPPQGNPRLWTSGATHGRIAAADIMGSAFVPPFDGQMLRIKSDALDFWIYGSMATEPGDDEIHSSPFSGGWWKVRAQGDVVKGAVYIGPAGRPHALKDYINCGMGAHSLWQRLKSETSQN